MRNLFSPWRRTRPFRPWVAALVLLLSGCVRFQPKPLDSGTMAGDFDARTLDTPALRLFLEENLGPLAVWPPPQWTFEQLALAALYHHPKLDVARAELGAARAAEITAGARPNPVAGVAPEYTVNPAGGVSPWIATVQLDIPIETAGKRGHRVARARQLSEAARLRLGSAAWEIRSGVRAAWIDLGEATLRTNLLARQLAGQARVMAALDGKLALGAATAAEAAAPRLALARTRKAIADARVQADGARALLASAVGVPLGALPPSAGALSQLATNSWLESSEARRRALTSRASLLAALAEYAAAETALRLEIAKQIPDVHAGPGYQYDQGENKWMLGVSVELPVFNRNQGPIAEASAQRAEAAARVVALQAGIIGEVDRGLAAWRGAQTRLTALEDLCAAQQARVDSIRAQFEAGAAESLDLLLAEAELAAAELSQGEARMGALRAFGELEDAIQFPLPVPERGFDPLARSSTPTPAPFRFP